MIKKDSALGKFSVVLQADSNPLGDVFVYTMSNSSMQFTINTTPAVYEITLLIAETGGDTRALSYYTDPDGVLGIPMKNIFAAAKAKGVNEVIIEIWATDFTTYTDVDGTVRFECAVLNGISYYDMNAPMNNDMDNPYRLSGNTFIVPPNVILNPAKLSGNNAPGVIVESNFHKSVSPNLSWYEISNGTPTLVTPSGERGNQVEAPASATELRLIDSDSVLIKSWPLTKADSCTDMVCIRWTSLTGAVRQHFFPIVARTTGSDKDVSLLTPGDGYDVTKNVYNGVVCRITGLTAYGYWYYMDLVRASDVHAIVHQTEANWEDEINNPQTSAYVELNTAETPQGVGFFNFEFTIKLRHYGKV